MTDLALHRCIVPYFTSASFFPGRPLLRNGRGPPSESPQSVSIDGRMPSVCATVQKMSLPENLDWRGPPVPPRLAFRGDQRRSYGAEIRASDVSRLQINHSLGWAFSATKGCSEYKPRGALNLARLPAPIPRAAGFGHRPDQNVRRAPSQRTRLPGSLPKKPWPGGERVPVISPKFEVPTVAFGLLKWGVLVK